MGERWTMRAPTNYLRVDLADDAEVEYWVLVLDVPRARLEAAVRRVGCDAEAVRDFLQSGSPD
jgi:hypothetical protein